jgi:Ca2+ transporting ATPase
MIITKYLNDEELWNLGTLSRVMDCVVLSITIVVVAVPEGLPLAVTISLAYSVMKMKEDKNLVRRLDASETMGGADQICSDKTGTLTQNKMSVVSLYIEDRIERNIDHCSDQTKASLYISIGVNSTAELLIDSKNEGKEIRHGNQTECGLLDFIRKYKQDYQQIRSSNSEVFGIPFSSKRKRMTTVTQSPLNKDNYIVLSKGASEIILELSNKYVAEGGVLKDLDAKKTNEIHEKVISNFANQAYRTLSIAYKEVSKEDFDSIMKDYTKDDEEKVEQFLESDLILLAIVGIQDPLREGIPEAIGRCKRAGVTVRMVTGDHINTAKAIAINAGILNRNEINQKYACMDGKTFREEVGGLEE